MTDLSIVSIETTILDVPLVRPHRFATTSMTAQPLLLVAIRTSDGVIGYGEGVVPGGPWWGGESVETMQVIIEKYIAPVVVGRRVDHITVIMADIEKVVANARFAKAAVDVALHDAWARSLGVPVHTLLGGAFRESVDVTWALGAAPADEIIEEAHEKLESRLNFSFKLKMGALDPAVDVARIVNIAQALDGHAGVRVDVNARWDRFTALRYLPQLAEGGVELIEQPTPADQIEVLAELSSFYRFRSWPTRVCRPHTTLWKSPAGAPPMSSPSRPPNVVASSAAATSSRLPSRRYRVPRCDVHRRPDRHGRFVALRVRRARNQLRNRAFRPTALQ